MVNKDKINTFLGWWWHFLLSACPLPSSTGRTLNISKKTFSLKILNQMDGVVVISSNLKAHENIWVYSNVELILG
jgi:hypothetical protein